MGNVQIGRFEELPNRIRAEDIVLDVGGGVDPSAELTLYWIFCPGTTTSRQNHTSESYGRHPTSPKKTGCNGIFARIKHGLSKTSSSILSFVSRRLKI